MARKNWRQIADKEFRSMDKSWQDDWQDLRDRTN